MSAAFSDLRERTLVAPGDLAARAALLAARGLSLPANESLVLGLFEGERLVATGALAGNIIQGIAVAPEFEGEGGASGIVTALLKAASARGITHVFVYTKPQEAGKFESLGFSRVAEVETEAPDSGATGRLAVALLEWGARSVADAARAFARAAEGKPEGAGAVVVNCNPFTLGHRRLIEYAASQTPWLYVLVVEENRSLFPFEVRLDLVRRGTADLPRVTVLPSGPYVISSATFPTYFLRPSGAPRAAVAAPAGGPAPTLAAVSAEAAAVWDAEAAKTALYAELDLEVFKRHIAPPLKLASRFVGTEPYCATTSVYNECMKRRLPRVEAGASPPPALRVVELPRLEKEGEAVSASRVRALIRSGELGAVRTLVPPVTWDWLNSEGARPVLEAIRTSDTRH